MRRGELAETWSSRNKQADRLAVSCRFVTTGALPYVDKSNCGCAGGQFLEKAVE